MEGPLTGSVALSGEHGFWDYTCPQSGGLEFYTRDDYIELFDDMESANMNSLLMMIKWWTTGYRSRLPYLDQLAGNPMIESDNDLLRWVIEEGHRRGIKIWLGAVMTFFDTALFGGTPTTRIRNVRGWEFPFEVGVYDSDSPEVQQRGVAIAEEIVTLFPTIDGLLIEIEHAGRENAHRIPLYNKWAAENGRPAFEGLGRP